MSNLGVERLTGRVTSKNYQGIRKVSWDSMWHVMFLTHNGKDSYHRVTQAEAFKAKEKFDQTFEG